MLVLQNMKVISMSSIWPDARLCDSIPKALTVCRQPLDIGQRIIASLQYEQVKSKVRTDDS